MAPIQYLMIRLIVGYHKVLKSRNRVLKYSYGFEIWQEPFSTDLAPSRICEIFRYNKTLMRYEFSPPHPLAGCMWISASTTGYREEVVHITRKGRNVLFVWMFADVNECRSENGGCEQICENTDGSFRCSCRSGYTLNFDQRSCDSKYTCKGYRRYMETPKDCITGLSWEESTDPR